MDTGVRWPRRGVFRVEITNRLGELTRLARVLEDDGIEILFIVPSPAGSKARCVVGVDRPEPARQALERCGFSYLGPSED